MLARTLICLALFAITLAVFAQIRNFDFVGIDDAAYIVENPWLYDGYSAENVGRVFGAPYHDNYMPLTALSFFADYERAATDPAAYHVTNLVLHVANVILLFLLLDRLTGSLWPSAFAAALFAVHPLHVESVAWVSERKDVLSAFFAWLALAAYAWYAQKPRVLPCLLVAGLFAAGLLSKPMLVTLPCVMLLLDFWPLERAALVRADARKWGQLVLEKAPLLAMSVAVSIVTVIVQREARADTGILSVPDRVANAAIAYMGYLAKMAWPANLIPSYPYDRDAFTLWQVGGAAVVLLAVTIIAWRLRARFPYVLVGWLWYLGTLVPVIGLVQVGGQSMADRYTYIPLVGVFIIVAWGAADLVRMRPNLRPPAALAAAAIVATMTVVAYRQTMHWRDSTHLFTHILQVRPDDPKSVGGLGFAYLETGRVDEALPLLELSIVVDPKSGINRRNLAEVYRRLGRLDEAERQLEIAFELGDNAAKTHNALALVLMDRGKLDAARAQLEAAMDAAPEYPEPYVNYGNLWLRLDQPDKAMAAYRAALERNPLQFEALNNMGAAYMLQDNPGDAVAYFREALEVAPEDVETRTNLAAALYELGNFEAARREVADALTRDPDYAKARELERSLKSRPGPPAETSP